MTEWVADGLTCWGLKGGCLHLLCQAIAVLLEQLVGLHDIAQLHAAVRAAAQPTHVDLGTAISAVTVCRSYQSRIGPNCLAWGR